MQSLLPPRLVALLALAMTAIVLATGSSWPWPIRVVGLVTLIGGMALTVRHAQLFDDVGTNIKTFDDPDTLVRSGAFSFTRNPMYLGFALLLAGLAMLLASPIAVLGPAVFVLVADRWYIPFEEQRLTAAFGNDYLLYQDEVRRWVGRRARQ